MYRLQLSPDIAFWTADGKPDKRKPAKAQGLVFFMSVGPQEKHPSAGHPGGVKGTTSQFTNYFLDDVVVAVHFNVDEHNVNAGQGCRHAGRALPAGEWNGEAVTAKTRYEPGLLLWFVLTARCFAASDTETEAPVKWIRQHAMALTTVEPSPRSP